MEPLDAQVRAAVRHFWQTLNRQSGKQAERGVSDQGKRGAVTGGKQMDGFVHVVRDVLLECGLSDCEIFYNSGLELPGYYRPEKQWDVLVVADHKLIAAIEFKSQASSFGNNFNNRVEEAVGSATDLWTAYRDGAIPLTPMPWLGYLMLLVESPGSTRPVRVSEPHFDVFPEFKGSSYAERYRLLMSKLMREKKYSATCFLMTPEEGGREGLWSEPDPDLSFQNFVASLRAQVKMFQEMK